MRVVQKPMPRIGTEIEGDLLGLTDVEGLADYRSSFLPLIHTGDLEMGNCPVLSIDPENEVQTSNFALRLSLIVAQEFFQTGSINVVWRRIRRMGRLGRYKAPVTFGNEGLRVFDPGRSRKQEDT